MKRLFSILLVLSCIVSYSLCMELRVGTDSCSFTGTLDDLARLMYIKKSGSSSLPAPKGCLLSCGRVRSEESKKKLVWLSKKMVNKCETIKHAMGDSTDAENDYNTTFEDILNARNCNESKFWDFGEDIIRAIPIIPIPIDVDWVELLIQFDKKKKPMFVEREWGWTGKIKDLPFGRLQQLFIVSNFLDHSKSDEILDELTNRIKTKDKLTSILRGEDSLELLAGHSPLIIEKLKGSLLLKYFLNKKPFNFKGKEGRINVLSISPDQKYLITGSKNGAVKVWNITKHELLHSLEDSLCIDTPFFTPDSKRVIIAGETKDSEIINTSIWDIETGNKLQSFDDCVTLNLTKDGSKLFLFCTDDDGRPRGTLWIKIWDMLQESMVGQILYDGDELLKVNLDGTKLIVQDYNKVLIHKIEPFEIEHKLEHWKYKIEDIQLTPDGKKCVTRGEDRVGIWDLDTGELVLKLPVDQFWIGSIRHSFVLDNTRIFILADGDGYIFDMKTGKILLKLDGAIEKHVMMEDPSFCLFKEKQFGELLVGYHLEYNGESGGIVIWDLQTGSLLDTKKAEGHGWILSVDITLDGKQLVAGCEDGTTKIWNLYDDDFQVALDEASLEEFLLCNFAVTDHDAVKELIKTSEYTRKIHDSCPEVLQNMISGPVFAKFLRALPVFVKITSCYAKFLQPRSY